MDFVDERPKKKVKRDRAANAIVVPPCSLQGIIAMLEEYVSLRQSTDRPPRCITPPPSPAVASTDNSSKNATATTMFGKFTSCLYDEGMHEYRHELVVENDSETFASTIHQYNTGLQHLRCQRYGIARDCFHRARELATAAARQKGAGCDEEKSAILLTKIHHNLGYAFYNLGEKNNATQCYRKAFELVHTWNLDDLHYAIASNCIAILIYYGCDDKVCHLWAIRLLEGCVRTYRTHASSHQKQLATVLNNLGRVWYTVGDFAQSVRYFLQAIDTRKLLFETESADVAATICNVGHSHLHLHQPQTALQAFKVFLRMVENGLAIKPNEVCHVYKVVAKIYNDMGDHASAALMYKEALELTKIIHGPEHPLVASILNRLGCAFFKASKMEMAVQYFSEGLELERRLQCDPSTITVTLLNIAGIHRALGNYSAAFREYNDALNLQLETLGPQSIEVASTLLEMATTCRCLNLPHAEYELYQRALHVQRDFYGTDLEPAVVTTINAIGMVLYRQRRYTQAREWFTKTLQIRQRLHPADSIEVAAGFYNLASVELEEERHSEAIVLYKEALRIERARLGRHHPRSILTLQHLGMAYQQSGELEQSLDYFKCALDIEMIREDRSDLLIAGKLLNVIGNIHLQMGNITEMMDCFSMSVRILNDESTDEQRHLLLIAGYCFYSFSKLHPPCSPAA